jgi:phage N-6-adenine-methyltransferase
MKKSLQPLMKSDRQDWETPPAFIEYVEQDIIGRKITFDVCALPETAKAPNYFTPADDGLTRDWPRKGVCWMNPPYDELAAWLKKAADEALGGSVVVALIPARTDTVAFQEAASRASAVVFIKGRLKFVGAKDSAPFPSALLIFNPRDIATRFIFCSPTPQQRGYPVRKLIRRA